MGAIQLTQVCVIAMYKKYLTVSMVGFTAVLLSFHFTHRVLFVSAMLQQH